MRLSKFIETEKEKILEAWVEFARTRLPATDLTVDDLRDHAAEMLEAVVADMGRRQTDEEQIQKSQGKGAGGHVDAVGKEHADSRLDLGFDINQLAAEYRALRASVLRLWEENLPETKSTDRGDLTRFNESIDQMLTESISRYTKSVNRTRDQFLGILGHDLRMPLGAIVMSASYLSRAEGMSAQHAKSASRILNSSLRMGRMVDLLLDLTRIRLGNGIPISRSEVDLRVLCRQVLDELEAFHPDLVTRFEATGDLTGAWDGDRLSQVLSNLVGNALKHGSPESPVTVRLQPIEGEQVLLQVHNLGAAIPRSELGTIFAPMVQGSGRDLSSGLGLGLYIVREVVSAHGGTVSVTSTEAAGTTFSVQLPRAAPVTAPEHAAPLTH